MQVAVVAVDRRATPFLNPRVILYRVPVPAPAMAGRATNYCPRPRSQTEFASEENYLFPVTIIGQTQSA
jgi:hypothetical protein